MKKDHLVFRIRDRRRSEGIACVLGGMDLIRPLGLAGIRCSAVAGPEDAARYSRLVDDVIDRAADARSEELVVSLVGFGARQKEPPVLYYETDSDLLLVSRFRDQLGGTFRFLLPDADVVENLVDKVRFSELAARLELPVPPTRKLAEAGPRPVGLGLRFPVIVKPAWRRGRYWSDIGREAKALEVGTLEDLHESWAHFSGRGPFVAQEIVPGPESAIESYHAYIDRAGRVVGEFTGRKLRTFPLHYGFSTALTITASADVASLGREVLRRVDVRGVAKVDFKRSPSGELYLLEINPRYSLWHHLGAMAGVNLPGIAFDDLSGRALPAVGLARPGLRWCTIRDVRAAKAEGESILRWLRFLLTSDAISVAAWDDPLPFIRGMLVPQLARAWRRSKNASAGSGCK